MANLYADLSKLKFLRKNYSLKFLFLAFIGIHVPLIIIVIGAFTGLLSFTAAPVILVTLAATLVSTVVTLYFLNQLLWPLHKAKKALEDYMANRKLPSLPCYYEDEAGVLLKEVQHTVEHLDYLIGEKKDVITILSHDIRTPFNQVLGLAGMIELETDRNEINKYVQTIKDVSVRNLMVLNDILTLLKTDYAVEGENTQIELNDMVAMVCHHLSPSAKSKSIAIRIRKTEPVFVMANKVLFTEALNNLVSNAIKFSYPASEIDIHIGEHEGAACIQVKDYGIGISEEDKTIIFTRFTSAGKVGTAGEQTSGVGLYLSRKIISKNKGHLLVESEGKDKGATFTILLPKLNKNLN